MGEVEFAVTKSWASIFINTANKKELLYEDLIEIYHVMYDLKMPGRFSLLWAKSVISEYRDLIEFWESNMVVKAKSTKP